MAARRASPSRGAPVRKISPSRSAPAGKAGRGAQTDGSSAAGASAEGSRVAGSRDALAEVQRTRLLSAMAVVSRRTGPGRVTVSDVVKHAGVSRRTFYEFFSDREACLTDAVEEGLRRACGRVVAAYDAQRDWSHAVGAGLEAFLSFLDEDRTFGSLLVIDALAGGDAVLRRRVEVLRTLARAICRGRGGRRPRRRVSPLAAQAAIGGVLAVLHTRLLLEPEKPVSPLAGELAADVLNAGLGVRVSVRPVSKTAARGARANGGAVAPLASIDVRLTYRTLLVLRALAKQETGGAGMSNREVAEAAGIADQGQASKLLARLAAHGLIANARRGSYRDGEPNAWRLTERGVDVEWATRRAGE